VEVVDVDVDVSVLILTWSPILILGS